MDNSRSQTSDCSSGLPSMTAWILTEYPFQQCWMGLGFKVIHCVSMFLQSICTKHHTRFFFLIKSETKMEQNQIWWLKYKFSPCKLWHNPLKSLINWVYKFCVAEGQNTSHNWKIPQNWRKLTNQSNINLEKNILLCEVFRIELGCSLFDVCQHNHFIISC